MTGQDDTSQTPAEEPTHELPPTTEQAEPAGPKRLLRSQNDRIIGGVSGGLGRYFDVDPVIFRIAFAVSILFGGLGIVAYLAAWLFVPADDGQGAPVPPQRGRGFVRAVGVIALVIAGLFGFGALVTGAAFVTGIGYGYIVAGAIVLIGVALIVTSFRGGVRWLLVPALALSIGVGVAAAADLDLEGGIGNREYRPASASAIPADGYELGVGRLAVDLRDIDWSPERVVELDASLGAGELAIAVPSDVCVVADAHAGAGELRIAGQWADGFDVELNTAAGATATPQLRLDADVDMGQIRVINNDAIDINVGDGGFAQHDGSWGGQDSASAAEAREANEAACSA